MAGFSTLKHGSDTIAASITEAHEAWEADDIDRAVFLLATVEQDCETLRRQANEARVGLLVHGNTEAATA